MAVAGASNTLSQGKPAPLEAIMPGEDIQARVNKAPPGTTFLLQSGMHRMQAIVPRSGDTFTGEAGTVLSGARLLTTLSRSGSYWVATGQMRQIRSTPGGAPCRKGYPRCNYPEDLFINDVPLLHVTNLSDLGPGKWHLDDTAGQVCLGDDPTGKKVELSVTPKAFTGTATNVTIRNLTIEKYASPTQQATVELGPGWIIEDSELRWNHFTGIACGPRSIARRNRVHHNGCFGFHGAGNDILVANNEIAYNGFAGYDPFWGAGGSKWVYTSNLIVRENFSHHNRGPGLWTDINNIHTLYEENLVEDNERGGIFHEISYDATIRTNIARRNGTGKDYPHWTTGAGIEIVSSRNVEIYGNTLEDNWQGITGLDDHRGTGNAGPWTLINLNVHDNIVTSRITDEGGGFTGLIDTKGTNAFSAAANNRFRQNTYSLGTKRHYFLWNGKELDEIEWQAFSQDVPSRAAATSSVLEQAARGIETHRKGDATIRLVRKDGSPVSGAKVEAVLRTHDFAFGNLIRPRHYTNEQYRARFLELFNFIQLLEFNWGQYEREEGKPKLAERRAFIDGWCRSNGLTRFYGHMLTWAYQMDEERDIGPVNPFWLMRYDRDTQFRLLRQRIEREVRAYRDVDILWDVVNEAIHCRRWGDWSKPNDVDEPIAAVLPYVRDALRWAHEANPNARLMINDYRILPAGKYRDRYRELVEELKKENAPLHAIGIQAHSPGNGAHWFSPEEIWQTCELFGTQLGLPIYFTEFWQMSDSKRVMSGARTGGHWSPDLQAEAIEQFYRVAFGHPAVQAIIYFGMIDGETESPTLGLLDANFQPKPAWLRLKKLIKEEWHTQQSANTDAQGVYRFRGFFGQYEVRVTEAGRQHTFRAHLAKDQPKEWNFTVD